MRKGRTFLIHSNPPILYYTILYYTTVYAIIFAVLARCGNSRVVNFAILLMLSLLFIDINWSGNFREGLTRENKTTAKISARTVYYTIILYYYGIRIVYNLDLEKMRWNKDCFHTRAKVRNLNYRLNCAIWIIIRMTVFWTVCIQNFNVMHDLNCTIRMMVPTIIWTAHFKLRISSKHCNLNLALVFKKWVTLNDTIHDV